MVRSSAWLGLLAMILATAAPLAAQTPLRVFPNPVSADRHLTLDHADTADAEPEVFDVLGRAVDPGVPLPAGRYVVRLRYADGRVSAPAPLTLATPGPLSFRSREASPVMTAVEPKPIRVRNIFICSGVVFWLSSKMMYELLSVRPRM